MDSEAGTLPPAFAIEGFERDRKGQRSRASREAPLSFVIPEGMSAGLPATPIRIHAPRHAARDGAMLAPARP